MTATKSQHVLLQVFLAALAALVLATGCSSIERSLLPNTTADVDALKQQTAALASQVTDISAQVDRKADRTVVAAVTKQVADLAASHLTAVGLLKQTADALGTKADKAEVALLAAQTDRVIADLNARTDKTDRSVEALAANQARTDRALAATGRNVAALGSKVGKVQQRVANSEHAAMMGDVVRVIPIYGFPVAKYDEGKKEFFACGELADAMKKELDGRVGPLVTKLGWNVREVRGLASVEKFGGKQQKVSDELNNLCALQRAKSVAAYLAEATKGDVSAIGIGTTADYGAHDRNRAANVVLELPVDNRAVEVVKPTAAAPPAPAPVPAPAPAPAPPAPTKP